MATAARRVLVTGATSGIGAGIARAFAAAGDSVVATGATEAEVAGGARHRRHRRAAPGRARRRGRRRAGRRARRARRRRQLRRRHSPRRRARPGRLRRDGRHQPHRHDAGLRRRPRRPEGAPRLHRQHRLDAQLLRRRPGAGLQRQQGRRRAADQEPGDRLRGRRHPRQRRRARLDRDAADPGAAGRPGALGADPGAHAARPLGHARGRRRPGAVPGQRRGRASSPASCCRSTAAISSPEGELHDRPTARHPAGDRRPGHPRRRARLGAAGARRLVPPAAAQHRHRQLVQPAARAQAPACCRATSIRPGSPAT